MLRTALLTLAQADTTADDENVVVRFVIGLLITIVAAAVIYFGGRRMNDARVHDAAAPVAFIVLVIGVLLTVVWAL
jgi:glycerol uptake facilitator-like aquaporin